MEQENQELIQFKKQLHNVHGLLKNASNSTEAYSCSQYYEQVLRTYKELKDQDFNMESWKIRNKIDRDVDSAIKNMKDDISDMHLSLFGEGLY